MFTLLLALLLQLPPADIQAAIAEGQTTHEEDIGVRVGGEVGGFRVVARGPYGRVAVAASRAKAKYQPLEEFTPEVTANTLVIFATPHPPSFSRYGSAITPAAERMVLRAKGQEAVIQPTKCDPFFVTWKNRMGASINGQGVVATFDLASLPEGDLEVIIPTPDVRGERRYTIKAKDRAKLR